MIAVTITPALAKNIICNYRVHSLQSLRSTTQFIRIHVAIISDALSGFSSQIFLCTAKVTVTQQPIWTIRNVELKKSSRRNIFPVSLISRPALGSLPQSLALVPLPPLTCQTCLSTPTPLVHGTKGNKAAQTGYDVMAKPAQTSLDKWNSLKINETCLRRPLRHTV